MGQRDDEEWPSEKNPRAFRIVEEAVQEHLSRERAWPRTIFEFELRGAGVYPDFAGRSLHELNYKGQIGNQVESNGRKYFTRPDEEADPSPVIENAVDKYYDLLDEVGQFGELIAYAALCHVQKEYDDIHYVLPETNLTHRLKGIPYEPDAFLEYGEKCTPVEVYNGAEYITEGHKKIKQQVLPAASRENPHSRPIFIAPLASKEAEDTVLNGDGVITQTGKPVVCENKLEEYSSELQYLNLKSNFRFVKPIKTKGGEEIDGKEFKDILGSSEYSKITPEKIQTGRIPEEYVKRVRGGVQLTYVNSLYNKATSKIHEYACLVLQPLFHHLLRHDALPIDELLTYGWDDLGDRYPRVKANVAKDSVLSQTRNYIEDLTENKILEQSSNRYSTYRSYHPHLSLSLDESLPL